MPVKFCARVKFYHSYAHTGLIMPHHGLSVNFACRLVYQKIFSLGQLHII
jgi:hypothetical protein